MDNLYEINIKNIQHLNKHTSENDIIRQIILNLKWHFLRENNIYVNTENLPDDLKVGIDKILKDFEKVNKVPGIEAKYFLPMLIDRNFQNYFIVITDNKVCDFDSNVLIPSDYTFYEWFLALTIVQTPIEKTGEMLDFILTKKYSNDIAKLKFDIDNVIITFQKKYIQPELRLYNNFTENEINLFSIYKIDIKVLKRKIKSWFKWKESHKKSETSADKIKEKRALRINEITNALIEKKLIKVEFGNLLKTLVKEGGLNPKENTTLALWKRYVIFYLLADNKIIELKDFSFNSSEEKNNKSLIFDFIMSNFRGDKYEGIGRRNISNSISREKKKEVYNPKYKKYISNYEKYFKDVKNIVLQKK